jgi:hypothetical protein
MRAKVHFFQFRIGGAFEPCFFNKEEILGEIAGVSVVKIPKSQLKYYATNLEYMTSYM